MKNKLKFLIGVSLKRKIQTKWFYIANICIALVIIGLANIDHIINFFGGDFDQKTKIYIIDNTDVAFDIFVTSADSSFSLTDNNEDKYEIINYDKTKEEIIETIKNNEEESNSLALVFDLDEENILNVELISNNFVDALDMSMINSAANSVKVYLAMEKFEISEEEIAIINSGVNINRTVLDESKDSADENMEMIMSTVFPIFILPFFILVIFLVQMIGAEINEEKTSKSMEIIISSVSPNTHFISKMVTVNVFVIIQSLLILIYSAIGLFIRSKLHGAGILESFGINVGQIGEMISGSNLLQEVIVSLPLVVILLILSIVAYSLLAGILASMTTSIEDYQQLQTPLMILIMVGYYLALMASSFENSTFITIFSVVPFISALLAPVLLIMGQIGLIEIIISIVLLIIVIALFFRYGIRIYKVGILNYSTSKLWTKLFKAIKEKN